MTDPVKQREMEVKVSQSQQKMSEWQEELKNLKGFWYFLFTYNALKKDIVLIVCCKTSIEIIHISCLHFVYFFLCSV